ncbi:hypothetical protein PHMEG_00027388 [Phytophthora megakarya]|uniref:RING-type domain-containing protein n=1 Tax=Phytophthora megakarya TaxID=4795 RepID=A0A225V7C4_9STRA|nr:hypothetical protein PHMEG_00027388 [Phytophthora megakarya]
MEDEHSQEEDECEEKGGEKDTEETEENEAVELDGDEQELKQESDDDVEFVGSVDGADEDDDVEILESHEPTSPTQRSRAATDAMMVAKGFVTPTALEAELQCIICQYAMFKPVSAICGHSFCRVCLMDSFLTRPIEETQCPICRVDILKPIRAESSLTSVFSVNVTLWNLVQLLIPSVKERILSYQEEEEETFTQKLDELDAKWKIFTLRERAAIYHGDHDAEDGRAGDRWEEDHEGHEEYPVIKVEDTHDGNLHVSRNVVLDINDENEDGVLNMRVGIAIVEFPSVFELYNEHQECSVNVIKMEEDEEMSDGMPFFMNEDGDDDGFVCGTYYNEISLHVCDEAGNCVMERTRGAQGGVVAFPGLRLDVPGGLYTFRFSDDLYGLKLSVTTRLREPHEISDTPVADYVSLIQGEARDASRRNRSRHHDSDEDHDEEGNESDDSFIVNDLTERAPVGRFSDDEDHWEYHSDDEAADEEREQQESHEGGLSGEEQDHEADEDEHEVEDHDEDGHDEDEHDEDEEIDDEMVRSGRRNVRVIDEATFSSDGEAEQEENDDSDGEDIKEEEEHHDTYEVARSRRRNANQIVDSEDEDDNAPEECDDEEKNEDDSDEEKKENVISDGANDHSENDGTHSDGGSPAEGEHCSDDDDSEVQPPTRKVKREQWFEDDESDEETLEPGHRGETPRRPQKRSRAQERQVRVVDEEESEEEQMERSIIAANSEHGHDDDTDEDGDSESQFRRVQVYDEEEAEECHEDEDAQDDYDAPDYPDDENEYQEEDDDF